MDREIAVVSSDGVEDVLNLPEEILQLSESCSLDVCKLPIYTLGESELVTGMETEALRNIHALKREFGAVVQSALSKGNED